MIEEYTCYIEQFPHALPRRGRTTSLWSLRMRSTYHHLLWHRWWWWIGGRLLPGVLRANISTALSRQIDSASNHAAGRI